MFREHIGTAIDHARDALTYLLPPLYVGIGAFLGFLIAAFGFNLFIGAYGGQSALLGLLALAIVTALISTLVAWAHVRRARATKSLIYEDKTTGVRSDFPIPPSFPGPRRQQYEGATSLALDALIDEADRYAAGILGLKPPAIGDKVTLHGRLIGFLDANVPQVGDTGVVCDVDLGARTARVAFAAVGQRPISFRWVPWTYLAESSPSLEDAARLNPC